MSNNDYFIKMLSFYYSQNQNYIYHNLSDNYIQKVCNKKSGITYNICENYLLLEAGEMDMLNYSIELRNTKKYEHIINLFYNLLKNFYKISNNFIKTKKKFLHIMI
jgi:hypothetical protein